MESTISHYYLTNIFKKCAKKIYSKKSESLNLDYSEAMETCYNNYIESFKIVTEAYDEHQGSIQVIGEFPDID